ncbi:MAG: O-antigen ligase family protein [Gemmatimonadales bacterium]
MTTEHTFETEVPAEGSTAPATGQPRQIDRFFGWLGSQVEASYVVYALFLMSGAWFQPMQDSWLVGAAESSVADSVFVPVYGILGLLVLLRFRTTLRAALAHKLTLLLIMLVVLSTLWSQASDVTWRRSIAIVATSAFGWYLVGRYSGRDILKLLAIAIGFGGLLSLYYGITDPATASMTGSNEWKGVFDNKNALARIAVLGFLLCLLLRIDRVRPPWPLWGAMGLFAGLLLMSQSKTGLLVLVMLVLLTHFSNTLRLRLTILIPLIIAAVTLIVGGAMWLHSHAATVATQVGRDVTMTGRTDLWAEALIMIQRHPLVGYGYGGFWRGWIGDSGEFWSAVQWQPPHAHNGFIDLTLDLGILGLALFFAGLVTAVTAAVARARWLRSASSTAPLVILSFVILYNITESSILRQNTVLWLVYVIAVSLACNGGQEVVVPGARSFPGANRA